MNSSYSPLNIENTNVVDAIGTERKTGDVVLSLIDGMDWAPENTAAEESHLALLRDKLENYLAFIESGQIFTSYPAAKGRKFRIDVIFRAEPTTRAVQLITRAGEMGAGFATSAEWRFDRVPEADNQTLHRILHDRHAAARG